MSWRRDKEKGATLDEYPIGKVKSSYS